MWIVRQVFLLACLVVWSCVLAKDEGGRSRVLYLAGVVKRSLAGAGRCLPVFQFNDRVVRFGQVVVRVRWRLYQVVFGHLLPIEVHVVTARCPFVPDFVKERAPLVVVAWYGLTMECVATSVLVASIRDYACQRGVVRLVNDRHGLRHDLLLEDVFSRRYLSLRVFEELRAYRARGDES